MVVVAAIVVAVVAVAVMIVMCLKTGAAQKRQIGFFCDFPLSQNWCSSKKTNWVFL